MLPRPARPKVPSVDRHASASPVVRARKRTRATGGREIHALAESAWRHLQRSGLRGLTRRERLLVTVWTFETRVAADGLIAYYRSPAGDLAAYAPAALRAVGARDLGAIAEAANAVFGPEGPPADLRARRAALARRSIREALARIVMPGGYR